MCIIFQILITPTPFISNPILPLLPLINVGALMLCSTVTTPYITYYSSTCLLFNVTFSNTSLWTYSFFFCHAIVRMYIYIEFYVLSACDDKMYFSLFYKFSNLYSVLLGKIICLHCVWNEHFFIYI